jgi:hypothetical protein
MKIIRMAFRVEDYIDPEAFVQWLQDIIHEENGAPTSIGLSPHVILDDDTPAKTIEATVWEPGLATRAVAFQEHS